MTCELLSYVHYKQCVYIYSGSFDFWYAYAEGFDGVEDLRHKYGPWYDNTDAKLCMVGPRLPSLTEDLSLLYSGTVWSIGRVVIWYGINS